MSWLSGFRPPTSGGDEAQGLREATDLPARPPLDLAAPPAVETATFAFG